MQHGPPFDALRESEPKRRNLTEQGMRVTRQLLLRLAVSLLFASLAGTSATWAAGGGGGGGGAPFTKGRTTRSQQAISEFQDGEKSISKAHKYERQLVEAREKGDEKKIAKLDGKRLKMYERANRDYRKAVKYDDSLFQAWSQLGYTRRKLGDYDGALTAYDRAIELEPRFAEAVEYRAEAYLHLGRLEDAKTAYIRLYKAVPALAEKLMVKMDEWHAERLESPGDMSEDTIWAFGDWLNERHEVAGPAAEVTPAERAVW